MIRLADAVTVKPNNVWGSSHEFRMFSVVLLIYDAAGSVPLKRKSNAKLGLFSL